MTGIRRTVIDYSAEYAQYRHMAGAAGKEESEMSDVQSKLVDAGVRNLKEFGYPGVTTENIMTDTVYKAFFASMLRDNIGAAGSNVDSAINDLLSKIEGGAA